MHYANKTTPDHGLTLTEQAVQCLSKDVMMGKFKAGQKLKLDQLQDFYGFSSSPLREALSRLTQAGLIRSDERKGFRVADISKQDLIDITEMRLILDVQALEKSILLGDDLWEAEIVATHYKLDKIERNLPDGPIALNASWVELHREFHFAILSACNSTRLKQWCTSLFDQAERYRQYSALNRKVNRKKSNEHKKLMDAVLRRDSLLAKKLLCEHIKSTQENVLIALDF
jgi:DNA-binding GntR family transcriptional regulator